jgi:hypothetical protein
MRFKRTLIIVVIILVVAISNTAINACMCSCGFQKIGISGVNSSCLGNLSVDSNCGFIGKSGLSFSSFPQIPIGTGITGNSKSNTTTQSNINSGVGVSGSNSQTNSTNTNSQIGGVTNSQLNTNLSVSIGK